MDALLNISICPEKTIVENTELACRWTLNTTDFLGDIMATLEKHFPDFECSQLALRIISHVSNVIKNRADESPVKIFGMTEIGETLYNLLVFIDDKKVLRPSFRDVETMRINNRMTANYLPVDILHSDTMRFEKLNTVTQVIIAYLYYCAYYERTLIRCRHCRKWFIVKTQKSKYCNRISPCYNMEIAGKKILNSPLSCEKAVRTITQKFRDREKSIYNNWYVNGNGSCYELIDQCDEFKKKIKANPTPENFYSFQSYLYSNSMPKQERPNRRKTITRWLLKQ